MRQAFQIWLSMVCLYIAQQHVDLNCRPACGRPPRPMISHVPQTVDGSTPLKPPLLVHISSLRMMFIHGLSTAKKANITIYTDLPFIHDIFHGSLNVPIEHHPTIMYMVYNGYYNVMSNIPKMGHLPTPVFCGSCRLKRSPRRGGNGFSAKQLLQETQHLRPPRELVQEHRIAPGSIDLEGGVHDIDLTGARHRISPVR